MSTISSISTLANSLETAADAQGSIKHPIPHYKKNCHDNFYPSAKAEVARNRKFILRMTALLQKRNVICFDRFHFPPTLSVLDLSIGTIRRARKLYWFVC